MPDVLPAPAEADTDWADVRPVLDAEIGRLPDKLRTVLVLCELQGLDRPTAAARLGVPLGTVSSRLSRAKEALRRRLIRRGITLSLVAVGLVLTRAAATAAVPPPLAAGAVADGVRFAVGTGSGLPAAVAAHVTQAMWAKKVLARAVIGVLALGLILLLIWGGSRLLRPDDRGRIKGNWVFVSFNFAGNDF